MKWGLLAEIVSLCYQYGPKAKREWIWINKILISSESIMECHRWTPKVNLKIPIMAWSPTWSRSCLEWSTSPPLASPAAPAPKGHGGVSRWNGGRDDKVSPHLGEGVHLPIVSVTSSRIETPVGSGRKVWILILQKIEKIWDRRSFCFSSIVVQTASFRACAILRFRDFFGNSRLSQILQVAERSNSGKHWVQDLCPRDNEKLSGV